jgi:hypothetical protein
MQVRIYIYLHSCIYKYIDVYQALMCVCAPAKTHKQCRVDIHSVSMHHRLRPWPIRSGCLEERARAGVGGFLSMNWLDISRLNHGFDDRRYKEVLWLFFDDSMRELGRSFGLKAGGTHELPWHSGSLENEMLFFQPNLAPLETIPFVKETVNKCWLM